MEMVEYKDVKRLLHKHISTLPTTQQGLWAERALFATSLTPTQDYLWKRNQIRQV